MSYSNQKEAILLLEDGTCFKGLAIGKIGTSGGELCFNTGMTGYQEIYTDPSYYGQIVVNTTPHIGNYGVLEKEVESDNVKIKGLVVRNFSSTFSRKNASGSLQDYLLRAGVVGIANVDTRMIVRTIRSKGAMNALISSEVTDPEELKKHFANVPSMHGLELASFVTCKEPYFVGKADAPFKVSVLDVGVKLSILSNLADRGCYCKVFPATSSFDELMSFNPDGFFISNGPGDPASMPHQTGIVTKMLDSKKPTFGICLGHQLLAQASGLRTYKMHNGHRGLNHPVKNLETGICEITSQNHGFAVKAEDVNKAANVKVTHINLNDQTIEGIRRTDLPAFSVQYHPESSPGPHDSRYLFDQLIALMKEAKG